MPKMAVAGLCNFWEQKHPLQNIAAIEKIAAPFCDKIICISDAEKQSALNKKICREDKLQVIFNGVDIEDDMSVLIIP